MSAEPAHDITEHELEGIARDQYSYEVRTLVEQVVALAELGSGPHDPVYLALVEAPLVHLRLLDDFFGKRIPGPDEPDDIVAQHYVDAWAPSHFLKWKVRNTINAQLQHLARRRRVGAKWQLGALCRSMAERHCDFVDLLAVHERHRLGWFDESTHICRTILEAQSWTPTDGLWGS